MSNSTQAKPERLIDARGPRYTAAITTVVLSAALVTESNLIKMIKDIINQEPEYIDGEEINPISGGFNKDPKPFNIGDTIKRIGGSELFEVLGYKGDMILMKPLNIESLYGMDNINPGVMNKSISLGYKPSYDRPLMVHYSYADEYKVIPRIK